MTVQHQHTTLPQTHTISIKVEYGFELDTLQESKQFQLFNSKICHCSVNLHVCDLLFQALDFFLSLCQIHIGPNASILSYCKYKVTFVKVKVSYSIHHPKSIQMWQNWKDQKKNRNNSST